MTDQIKPAVTLHEQVVCVRREIELRERVYPRFVASNKMKQENADREINRMKAVYATLRELEQHHDLFHDIDKYTGPKT